MDLAVFVVVFNMGAFVLAGRWFLEDLEEDCQRG